MSKKQKSDESLKDFIIKIVRKQKPESVSELISLVQEETNTSEEEILYFIKQLEAEKKIEFRVKINLENVSIGKYFFSSGSAWYWTTIALAIVATITVFIIPQELYPLAYIRNILGVIFVLFLPGFTLIKALFPTKVPIKTSSDNLDNIERVILSIGMSIAITPLVGLILYYTPLNIELTPITLSLFVFTAVFATIAIIREYYTKSAIT